MPLTRASRAFWRFLGDQRGSATIEAVLVFPLLCWAYLGTFVFFDGFRAQSVNVKTAYTIGDVLSRQTSSITPEFVDSMYSLQGVLGSTEGAQRLRITILYYDGPGDRLVKVFSWARGGGSAHTNATLNSMRNRVPALADQERAILVETWQTYTPPMDVGLDPLVMTEVAVTRPRFALQGRFCANTVNDGGPATEVC